MSLKKFFGQQVKLIRKSKNMTQEVLSESVDIDIRQLARIESGSSFATAETIEKLAKALGISYKDLFDFDESNQVLPENINSDSVLKFKNNYNKLNKLIQKIALSDEKTKYLILAIEALDKKSAMEKFQSLLLGMRLK